MSSTISAPWAYLPYEISAVFSRLQAQQNLKLNVDWPQGQGQQILVIPGFGASDLQTHHLRAFLQSQHYNCHGWKLGRNLGPKAGLKQALAQRLEQIHSINDSPCHLVGWSLGGVFARELARAHPERTAQVICLGSPLAGGDSTTINSAFKLLSRKPRQRASKRPSTNMAPPVPRTALYTKRDGIVAWQSAMESHGTDISNIQVPGSHLALPNNPYVWYAICQRMQSVSSSEVIWPQALKKLNWLA